MPRSLIALGSNLGDRQRSLGQAIDALGSLPAATQVRASRLHETAPVGGSPGQGMFLNAAVSLESTLDSSSLHAQLQAIENRLGRERPARWAPRTIDIDLLLHGSEIVNTPQLTLPHPRMAFRRFVLEPAAEVAADMVHPTIGWTVGRLLEHLRTAPPYVALLGWSREKAALAESLANACGGELLHWDRDSAVSRGLNPSGPALERQIQFLARMHELLTARPWPRNVPVVSDFYFDECLAYAKIELDPLAFEEFRLRWAAIPVVSPKLLVVLDAPAAVASIELRDELLQLAARPNLGPVLRIESCDPRERFNEIRAAIQAME